MTEKSKKRCQRFAQFVRDCEDKRLSQHEDDLKCNKKLVALSKKQDAPFNRIREGLPAELGTALVQYSDISTNISVFYEESYYRRGFTDCLCLLRGLFGKSNICTGTKQPV